MKLDLSAEECLALYNHLLEEKRNRKHQKADVDEDYFVPTKRHCKCCEPEERAVTVEDVLDRVLSRVESTITITLDTAGKERSFQKWEAAQKAKIAELEELEKFPQKKVEKEIENLRYDQAAPGVFVRIDDKDVNDEVAVPVKPRRKKK